MKAYYNTTHKKNYIASFYMPRYKSEYIDYFKKLKIKVTGMSLAALKSKYIEIQLHKGGTCVTSQK